MGQKINPTGFRLAVTHDWNSRWFATGKRFGRMLREDLKVRDYLRRKLRNASVGRILIERPARDARVLIYSARPGVVIGKKGEDIETLRSDLQKMMGVRVTVNIEEIRKPELDAQLIADSITQQLEKRIMFRRAMKRAMQNAMRLGAQGIKIMSAGRLNGIEIARTEWYREGRVPLHTLRADIDYGFSEAKTTYGVIGVKVWVYKGDTLGRNEAPAATEAPPPGERDDRRPSRRPPGDRPAGDRPGGGARPGSRRPPRRDGAAPATAAAARPAGDAAAPAAAAGPAADATADKPQAAAADKPAATGDGAAPPAGQLKRVRKGPPAKPGDAPPTGTGSGGGKDGGA
jgi:small subunit ribosomal protein S3